MNDLVVHPVIETNTILMPYLPCILLCITIY